MVYDIEFTSIEILSCFEKQMRLKGLAKNTIRSYVENVRNYLFFSSD